MSTSSQDPGPHGPPPPPGPPPFLQNASEDARIAFSEIMDDTNLTRLEIENKTSIWADTYNISEDYQKFVELEEEMNKNVTTIISNLPKVKTSLDEIFNNKNLTRDETKEAVDKLRTTYPAEVDTILHLRHPPPPPPPPYQAPRPPPGEQGVIGGFGGPQFTDDSSFLP